MRKLFIIAIALLISTIAASASAQISGKAALARISRSNQRAVTGTKKDQRTEGIISMIPIVIRANTKVSDKKNKIDLTISPTSINFGVTF
jgi:hypothetical protein